MNAPRRAAALLLFVLSVPLSASAQVADADRATARALAQQGQEALDKSDFAAAADRFGRADALVHAPTLMLGHARALLGLGKLVAAHELFARIVREGVPPSAPAPFVAAVAEARRLVEALAPRLPSVVITIKGPTSAKVTIDGVSVPAAALGVNRPVDPGKHTARAEAEGFAPSEVPFTVAEARSAAVTLELVPGPASSAPAPLAPTVQQPDGAPVQPAQAPGKPSETGKILGFTGLGLGGAGVVLGAVTGVLALQKHGELAKLCPIGHCTNQADAISAYHTMGMLSTTGFIAGGALAATGLVLLVTAPKARPASDAWLVPLIGPAFVGAEGKF